MKNKTLISSIFGLLLLISIAGAFAAQDGYCFMRLGNGQSIPTTIVSSTKHMTCDGSFCTVHGLRADSSFLQVCTDPKGFYASYTSCEKLCASGPNGSVANLTLNANWPFSDGGVYTKQTFFLDISTNKISSITLIDNIKGTSTNLCPNCASYKKSMTFKQGKNDFTIRAVRGGEIVYKYITFFIDNIKPLISKTLPSSGKFADGAFTIIYNEDNVVNTTLYYGDIASPLSVTRTTCPSGKSQSCVLGADLSEFDGKEIYYWFTMSDVAGNLVKSKAIKVLVDNTAPSLFGLTSTVSRSGVLFNMSITERNFDKVYYFDNGDTKGKVLCSSLNKGYCSKKVSFRPGHHEVAILVKDKAGNSVEQSVSFDM